MEAAQGRSRGGERGPSLALTSRKLDFSASWSTGYPRYAHSPLSPSINVMDDEQLPVAVNPGSYVYSPVCKRSPHQPRFPGHGQRQARVGRGGECLLSTDMLRLRWDRPWLGSDGASNGGHPTANRVAQAAPRMCSQYMQSHSTTEFRLSPARDRLQPHACVSPGNPQMLSVRRGCLVVGLLSLSDDTRCAMVPACTASRCP